MFGRGKVIVMKKFFAVALLAFAVIIGQTAQVSAQEVYLGEDAYLLTETVNYKPVSGKMMYFGCTIKQNTMNFDYDYMFYSDGLVVYDKMYFGEKRGSGRFNVNEPGSSSNTVAYKGFLVILKSYGLI